MAKKPTFKEIQASTEKKLDQLHVEREARCIPVAHEILKNMAARKLKIGDKKGITKKDIDAYQELTLEIIDLFMKHDIRYSERNFVFQLIMQAVEDTQNSLLQSLERSFDLVEEKALGKSFMDLTLKDMDKILKKK